MIVRKLTISDDLSSATHLLCRFFREEDFVTPEDVIAANTYCMAGLDTCGLFVAEADRKAVGVATVSMEFGIEYGWSAEMGDLYVLPEWRGQGVSRLLTAAIEDFLCSKNASGYQVTVTPYAEEHHRMSAYYASLGFEDEQRKILFKQLVAK